MSIGTTTDTLDQLFRHGFLSNSAGVVLEDFHQRCGQLTYLDISFGNLRSLSSLRRFTNLDTLVTDQNQLESMATCPALPNLKTLSLNNNSIKNLHLCLTDVQHKLSSLIFLSLLGNPCCPHSLDDPEVSACAQGTLLCIVFIMGCFLLTGRVVRFEVSSRASSHDKSRTTHI